MRMRIRESFWPWIQDPGWEKFGSGDKHPGSAPLPTRVNFEAYSTQMTQTRWIVAAFRCTWTCWLPRIRSSGTTWSPTPTGRRILCLWELWVRPAPILLDLLGKMKICVVTGEGLSNPHTVSKILGVNYFCEIFFNNLLVYRYRVRYPSFQYT
jgi:hypothetical protein